MTPHHLILTDEAMQDYDSNFKVMPPLRSAEHVEALIAGLADGTIDAISADHQPCAAEKKDRELDQVPFGIVGLETLLPLCVKVLIETKRLTWPELIAKLTTGPARVLKLSDAGSLANGVPADVAIIDPSVQWTIDPQQFRSKSRNTPFGGWKVSGQVRIVLVEGAVRYSGFVEG